MSDPNLGIGPWNVKCISTSATQDDRDRCEVYGLRSTRDGIIRYIGQTHGGAVARHKVWLSQARQGFPGRVCGWIREELAADHTVEIIVIVSDARWNADQTAQIAAHRAAGAPLLNVRKGGNWWKKGRKRDGARAAPPTPKPPPAQAEMHAALRSLSLDSQRRRRWSRWG